MSKIRSKFQVRVRSMTRPTRVFDRSGWRDSVGWTKWSKVAEFETYKEAAAEANDEKYRAGLRQVAVFFRGKPHRESRNHLGDLLRVLEGADALRGSGGNW